MEKEISSFLVIQRRSYSGEIFFGKTTFSEHLEKENMVFRAVPNSYGNSLGNLYIKFLILDNKFRFSCSESDHCKVPKYYHLYCRLDSLFGINLI